MDHLALKIDEVHASVFHEMRGKKRKSRKRAPRFARAQANTAALERVLLHRSRHGLIAANHRACPEGGRAGKQRASLQFMAHHLTLSISQVVIKSAVSRVAACWDRRRNRDKARRRDAARGRSFRDRRSPGQRRAAWT